MRFGTIRKKYYLVQIDDNDSGIEGYRQRINVSAYSLKYTDFLNPSVERLLN